MTSVKDKGDNGGTPPGSFYYYPVVTEVEAKFVDGRFKKSDSFSTTLKSLNSLFIWLVMKF